MALTSETDYLTAIKAHKRTLLEADWKAQSLENGFPIMQTQEVQDVLKQVDESDFYECKADLDSPCDCPACEKYEQESMAYAMVDYKPRVQDEHPDELCDDATCGCHDNCDRRDCETCFDYAVGQAEAAAEGMER